MFLKKLFPPKEDSIINLWDYNVNPLVLTGSAGLTPTQKHSLIQQAEEQYYGNQDSDFSDWIWQNVPMYIVQRPVSRIDILAQDGAVVLVSIIPTGSTQRSHIKPLDPIVPVVCGYDQLLQNETYTGYMDDLVLYMQQWIEDYQAGNRNAYVDSAYMHNARHCVEMIYDSVVKSALLSLREQTTLKTWLKLFAGNPLTSLKYALKQVE